ncbi:winged helix-turn-helix transcriptional regulator [Pseudonocardia spinosispora]|uniref:winged helix-turn-helix transcriptional regulator n=1 Tax=Pseudonocardia spinosispora TaxID=103441 RepID=UPI00040D59EB|nr:helix-turn-helix domain-containing protein [Pseudonocardia spinosispora]
MTSTASSLTLSGSLADRDSWITTGWCSIERTLAVVGTRSAMVLLREVLYGGRRFDDLARRAGITEAAAATRLKQLVEAGVLCLVPYREPRRRTRNEYVLTDKGRDLFPVLQALMQWGDTHRDDVPGGPIRMTHAGCGAEVTVRVECTEGHVVELEETVASAARTHP